MKRSLLGVFCALSLCTTTAAMAANPRIVERIRRMNITSAVQQSTGQQCANFTGSWKGVCVDDEGLSSDVAMTIEQQGCHHIEIDGTIFEVDGMVSLHSSPSRSAGNDPSNYNISFGWDDAQTKLHSLTVATILNGKLAGIAKQGMWLDGDRLRIKDEKSTSLFRDGSTVHMVAEDCTYERVKAHK